MMDGPCPPPSFGCEGMPTTSSANREPGSRPVQVLLVEDEPEGLSVLTGSIERLGNSGVRVECATGLDTALTRLSRGGIDLVLLDLDLPDERDLGTFERVYAYVPNLPIVVLARVGDEGMALSMVRAGAQDYLVKGEVSPDLLLRSIRYAVERHRLTSALRSLSLIDDLTGLYNRRGFSDLGEQHLKFARRSARGVLLVYLDVDDLKTINDTLGHQMGDRALVRVADVLRETFRQSDIIARIGGDEFAVMALEASEENETQLLDRLKRRFREGNQEAGVPFDLSVSLGASRFPGDGTTRLQDLLATVDDAMYREKFRKKRSSHREAHSKQMLLDT